MITQIAVADAYGAAYEFAPKPPPNDLIYHQHPTRKDDANIAEYTDDTQMTVAIMRHLVSVADWNQYAIAGCFLKEFKQYPINGYARGFQEFLKGCKTTISFMNHISPRSNRNGSVMRAVPVGVLPTVEDVVIYSYIQSSVTHCTPNACQAATAVALAAHFFYHGLDKHTDELRKVSEEGATAHVSKSLRAFLMETIGFNVQHVDTAVACDALETAHAAIGLAMKCKSVSSAMKKAVDLGGDTDSVASVACGLISLRRDLSIEDRFPPDHLIDGLSDNGRRPLRSMVKLETELFEKYPRIANYVSHGMNK